MKISIFGLGYVGCVSAACLANNNNSVIGVDVNQNKVDLINNGKATIVEKGISEIVKKVVEKKQLEATKDLVYAVNSSEISFITVGTPNNINGHLDLTVLYSVIRNIAKVIRTK